MGQTGWSQALKGVRLRKTFESEKEGSDAILWSPQSHKRTHFLSNMVVVCVAMVVPDNGVFQESASCQAPLGLETTMTLNFTALAW